MTKAKTTTRPEHPLFLVITQTRERGYFHLHARIATQKYDHQWDAAGWLPMGVDDTYSDGLLYSGLQVRAQGDADSQRRTDRDGVYGYDHVEYHDVFSVDQRKAHRMVRTLDYVERKLAKLRETRGYVKSFGEYCGRVAEAFGCSGIAVEREQPGPVTGARWDWMSVGDGVNRINHRVYLWQREALGDEARPAGEAVAS